jgi:hypothetical protein
MNKTIKIKTLALAVTAALVLPSAALANSSQEGYGGPNNVVAGIEESGGNTPPPTVNAVADTTAAAPAPVAETNSLPFTGADLGILAAAGALMLAFGFGLRRLTHSPSRP